MNAIAFALCAPLLSLPSQDDSSFAVDGRVVDHNGFPVTNAKVDTFWLFEGGKPTAYEAMELDVEGRFAGRIDAYSDPFGLACYDADGTRAGFLMVDKSSPHNLLIRLEPTIHVTLRVTCKELDQTPAWVNSYWSIGGYRMVGAETKDGRLDLRLPPGHYAWNLYDSYFNSKEGERIFTRRLHEVDLGTIDLPAHFLQKNQDKVLPAWTVSAARGVPLERSQIADFRGKWLLIEFWGYW